MGSERHPPRLETSEQREKKFDILQAQARVNFCRRILVDYAYSEVFRCYIDLRCAGAEINLFYQYERLFGVYRSPHIIRSTNLARLKSLFYRFLARFACCISFENTLYPNILTHSRRVSLPALIVSSYRLMYRIWS